MHYLQTAVVRPPPGTVLIGFVLCSRFNIARCMQLSNSNGGNKSCLKATSPTCCLDITSTHAERRMAINARLKKIPLKWLVFCCRTRLASTLSHTEYDLYLSPLITLIEFRARTLHWVYKRELFHGREFLKVSERKWIKINYHPVVRNRWPGEWDGVMSKPRSWAMSYFHEKP